MKVKAAEFELFEVMDNVLRNGVEHGTIDTQVDRVMQTFMKEHRRIIKQEGLNEKELPHSEQLYFDLFSAAFNMLC